MEDLVEKFFGEDAEQVRDMVVRMGWSDEEMRAFMNTMRKSGQMSAMVDEAAVPQVLAASSYFSSEMRGGMRAVRDVRYRLRDADKTYLRSIYGDFFDLRFAKTRGSDHSHPVIRVAKDLLDGYVWSRLSKGDRVLEVGPNPATAVRRGVEPGSYFGLVPVLDASDLERRSSAISLIRHELKNGRYDERQERAARDYLAGNNSEMFKKTVLERFTAEVDVLVSLNAPAVSLVTFVEAMSRCGAVDGYMTTDTMPHPALGVKEGRIGRSEMRFTTEGDKYVFFFDGSATRAYVHSKFDMDEMFMHDTRDVVTSTGERYVVDKLPMTNELATGWHVYRAPRGAFPVTTPTFVRTGLTPSVKLTTSEVDLTQPRGSSGRFVRSDVVIGLDTFSRILNKRMLDPKAGVEQVMALLRSNRASVVYGGVHHTQDEPIPFNDMTTAAVAINSIARTLFKEAVEESERVESTASTGGQFSSESVTDTFLSSLRGGVRRLAEPLLEFPPVEVELIPEVIVVPNEPLITAGGGGPSYCRRVAIVDTMLQKFGGWATTEEYSAEWLAQVRRKCGCNWCDEWRARREGRYEPDELGDDDEDESFTDAISVFSSDEPVSTVATENDKTDAFFDCSEIPLSGVAGGESSLLPVVSDYAHILRQRSRAAKDEARRACDRLVRAGATSANGFSLTSLANLSTDEMTHRAVEISAVGRVETIMNGGEIESVGLVLHPESGKFCKVVKEGGVYCVDPAFRGWCYTSTALEVWNYDELLASVSRVVEDPLFANSEPPDMPMVNGIWGTGKSFLAKKWFAEVARSGGRPAFLGAGRGPIETVRNELAEEMETDEFNPVIRTIDSALMHHTKLAGVTHLFIDEAALLFPGQVFAIWWLVRPQMIWLAGDFGQNKPLTFVAGLEPVFPTVAPFVRPVLLSETHRCGFDVCAAGLLVYGEDSGIRPCKCHNRPKESLNYHKVHNINNVDYKGHVMTPLQRTKKELRKLVVSKGWTHSEAIARVTTGVEFQGGTCDEATVIRDVRPKKKGSIFHEMLRANVQISRSVGPTTYWTVSDERDAMIQLIDASKSYRNRSIVADNLKERKAEKFGLVELMQFLDGTLGKEHPCVKAGVKFIDKFVKDFA
ncbi:methyltransferase [Erysiphe necator associated virga-like virus 10]|nr:methyltransferase [Erysiphe necator associated virga-like virus 10]